jgi:hypothetical protein
MKGRRRIFAYLLVGGAALLFAGFAFSKKSLRGMKVLHLGDSHVGGLKSRVGSIVAASGGSYVEHHQDGISTLVATQAGWDEIVATENPDIIIVTLGTNDRVSEAYPGYVDLLMAKLLEVTPDATIIWWGPPRLNRIDLVGRDEQVAYIQSSEVAANGGSFVNTSALGVESDGPDGVHLTAFGYGRWAELAMGESFWTRRLASR